MLFKLVAMIHWIAAFWNYLNLLEYEYISDNSTWMHAKGLEEADWRGNDFI